MESPESSLEADCPNEVPGSLRESILLEVLSGSRGHKQSSLR